MTLDLPAAIRDEVLAAVAAGIYADEEAFVADAVRTLLAARPDIRKAVACRLYARGVYSLGKAAEWSGLNIEQIEAGPAPACG
jgi:Arc/MetJ-type ribon-helix-helix transcriptional regulator